MIVAIGGCSNSGKSVLAKKLAETQPDKKSVILCQDDFTKPKPEIPLFKNHTDWEVPESIDFRKLKEAIIENSGKFDIVIAEGLMIYHSPDINKLFDKKLFVNIDKETFFKRKRNDLRWGKEPEWYINHIWESFLKYGQPPENDNEIIFIDGTKEFNIQEIASKVFGKSQ